MRKTEQRTLDRLWNTLIEMGMDPEEKPRAFGQHVPAPCDRVECLKLFLVESLFTGLYTTDPSILLRCWPQAAAYANTLQALGHEPGYYLRDRVAELRNRVEGHFLRDEV